MGLDAFAVPTRGPEGRGTSYRMLDTGLLYDPHKRPTLYVADFDPEAAARPLRPYARVFGRGRAETGVALTDGGNGREEASRGHVSDAVVFVLDFSHAAEHLASFGQVRHGRASPKGRSWFGETKEDGVRAGERSCRSI